MREIIAALKIASFFILSFLTIPLQGIGYVFLGNSRFFYLIPTFYYSSVCRIFRINVIQQGSQSSGHVVYVGNHLSYIDIAVVGAHLNATFISKAEVKTWPILGTLATLGRTIFIERSRNAATKCIADIKKTLSQGRNLILFPEGTSTDGWNVLPFKSTLFDLFLNSELKENLAVQPFTLTLKEINGHIANTKQDHDLYAWYADMTFMPHLWQLAKSKGADVLISFHPSRRAIDFEDRKEFARICQNDVAQGLKNTLPPALDFKSEAP